jgi:hypothetical protein
VILNLIQPKRTPKIKEAIVGILRGAWKPKRTFNEISTSTASLKLHHYVVSKVNQLKVRSPKILLAPRNLNKLVKLRHFKTADAMMKL